MINIMDNMVDIVRDKKNGRFLKGSQLGKKTQFKKGEHWRPKQKWWDKSWLEKQYKNKTATQIAEENNLTHGAITFWLKKHGIKTHSISKIRKMKHWGMKGKDNPMFGIIGKANPNWKGGGTPERQSWYAKLIWRELANKILERDNYQCQICFVGNKGKKSLHVHHIFSWAGYKDFRFNEFNLTTVCNECHKKIHSKWR